MQRKEKKNNSRGKRKLEERNTVNAEEETDMIINVIIFAYW